MTPGRRARPTSQIWNWYAPAPRFCRRPLYCAGYIAPAPMGREVTVEMATMPMENMTFDGLISISSHTPSSSGNTMLNVAIALGTICAMRNVTIT